MFWAEFAVESNRVRAQIKEAPANRFQWMRPFQRAERLGTMLRVYIPIHSRERKNRHRQGESALALLCTHTIARDRIRPLGRPLCGRAVQGLASPPWRRKRRGGLSSLPVRAHNKVCMCVCVFVRVRGRACVYLLRLRLDKYRAHPRSHIKAPFAREGSAHS